MDRSMSKLSCIILGGVVAAAGASATDASSVIADPEVAAWEANYMKFTADHHFMGVQMTELCLDEAVSDRLEELCATAMEDQAQEIDLVQGWLSDWYGETYEPSLSGMNERDLGLLGVFEGYEFDIEFSEMFIMHHRQIIDRSREALDHVQHQPLRDLAQHIIVEQSAEIEALEQIIQEAEAQIIPTPAASMLGAALLLSGTLRRGRRVAA